MPFLRSANSKLNNSTAHSLRAYLDTCQGGLKILSFLFQIVWTVSRPLKRASLFIAHSKVIWKVKASMTLEAAFALPFMLLTVINILFSVNIIAAQSRFNAALHQTGNKMAFAGYAYEKTAGGILPEELAGVAISELYAKNQIIDYVGRSYLQKSCIADGQGGISMKGSSVMEEGDIIDLRVSYRVKPFSELMGFKGFSMSQRYYGKAWTGYDVEQYVSDSHEEDPMVYVTETGTVYHLARNCTYLNPSVEAALVTVVSEKRNRSGAKYYPCERCGIKKEQGTVYFTEQGNRYHSDINCAGLKRTIYTIPLSQAGGRGRCSKCG